MVPTTILLHIGLNSALVVSVLIAAFPFIDAAMPYASIGRVHERLNPAEANTVLFVGDVLLARAVERSMDQYGARYPFLGVEDHLRAAAVVANFEAAVPSHHIPTRDYAMQFSVSEAYLPALAAGGITHASLANNHSYDYGTDGFTHTQTALEQAGVTVFGDQRSLGTSSVTYLQLPRATVAVVGIHAVDHDPSDEEIRAVFSYARRYSDVQVAYLHWGTEYHSTHSNEQAALARQVIDAGADAVVGHHPHVVQDIGVYDGVPIFYSLGNFIFDQFATLDVQRGLILALTVDRNARPSFSLIPVTSEYTPMSPRPMTGEARTHFLAALAERSDPSLHTSIIDGFFALYSGE